MDVNENVPTASRAGGGCRAGKWERLGVPERKEVTRSQKDTGARTWQERDHSNILKHGAIKQHTSKRTLGPEDISQETNVQGLKNVGCTGRGREGQGQTWGIVLEKRDLTSGV